MIEPYSREQSQIFGEDPSLYERFRPGYPRELMEAIVAETGSGPVLEIGAGTGKATRALVALGKKVHALEPDGRMAAVLEMSCGAGLSRLDQRRLEDVNLAPEAYDLVVAAQAWHWVNRDSGYDQVADALIPHGRLALLWHHPQDRQGLLGEAVIQLYRTLAPEIPHIWPGTKAIDFDPLEEPFAAAKRFRSWAKREHLWRRRLDAPSLIGWLCSSSEHRLLPIEQRSELMAALAALVKEMGGEVTVNMATVAHTAYRV